MIETDARARLRKRWANPAFPDVAQEIEKARAQLAELQRSAPLDLSDNVPAEVAQQVRILHLTAETALMAQFLALSDLQDARNALRLEKADRELDNARWRASWWRLAAVLGSRLRRPWWRP